MELIEGSTERPDRLDRGKLHCIPAGWVWVKAEDLAGGLDEMAHLILTPHDIVACLTVGGWPGIWIIGTEAQVQGDTMLVYPCVQGVGTGWEGYATAVIR